MKNVFSQFFKLLFCYSQYIAIVCVLLCCATNVNANEYKSKMTVKVATNSTGFGLVWISNTQDNEGALNENNYGTEKSVSQSDRIEGGNHSHVYYMYAWANDGYYHVGWSNLSEGTNVQDNSDNGTDYYSESLVGSKDQETSATRYAVFKRYYAATLYSYNAEYDVFENTPLGNLPLNSSSYSDLLNISVGNFEKMYKLSFNHPVDNIENIVCSSETFNCEINKIGEDIVLVVSSKEAISGSVSGDVFLSVNGEWNKERKVGGTVVTLNLTVSNVPITVTLNPAENLTGTYTYTQNTTGTEIFNVSTSPIVKQMLTAADYSFTFTPVSDKYQFEKWVIKNAEGVVVDERTESNLSYVFKAGESITPVFTTTDRAIFIVKSEPNIQYLDLQEALDRAAALGSGQVVTVYAPQKLTEPVRLVQGDYTIRNGVTFLVPGENSYTALTSDLAKKNFNDNFTNNNFSTYCTLVVDDNTNITVEKGNISLYAKLSSKQDYNGQACEHGHMILGKNCNIVVEQGGLYAFGFITGDNSSNIVMKDGTKVYEAFYFRDWVGGLEGTKFKSNHKKVFPVGQYYVQNIEVPLTLEYGAEEYVSTAVTITLAGTIVANVSLISKYDTDLCMFGLGEGTTLTKVYDPTTDRIKFELRGNGATSSNVKVGHLNLKLKTTLAGIDIDSKDYVLPIQSNMDLEVDGTTIDVKYDVAMMPGSTLRVEDDAVVNIETGVNMFVYDRGARKHADGVGFWSSHSSSIMPIHTNTRPGKVQCVRDEKNLVDARLIVNGVMNVNGALYTVKGAFAGEDTSEPEGGADITSEGGGKIYVNNIGTETITYQWKFGQGASPIELTSPNLLLHNSIAAGAPKAYTAVTENGAYTYYQHDGTWHSPQAGVTGVTGVKLYDASSNEIEKIVVTNPNVKTVDGYLLAILEPSDDVRYDENDFVVTLSGGNIKQNENGNIVIENGKLKIPVQYKTQNIDGDHPTTLTIANSEIAEFENISVNVVATEDYTPIFEVPASLNIYGRVLESTATTLPIEYPAGNVIEATDGANALTTSNPKWEANITGDGASLFTFQLGTIGNGLADAKVIFTPTDATTKFATLKLKAVYTDDKRVAKESVERTIELTGTGLMIANTLDFNNVGDITNKTPKFDLLRNVNSHGGLKCTIVDGENSIKVPNTGEYTSNEVVDIEYIKIDGKGNYQITPKAVGRVTIHIEQNKEGAYEGKMIKKTIVVVADPQSLTDLSCVLNLDDFSEFTSALVNVEYSEDKIKFINKAGVSSWTAHFGSQPGTLTFTPHGEGHWAIQESRDGVNWTEIVWWTQLPSEVQQIIPLYPTSRRLQISYVPTSETDLGYITDLCINPFSVYAETTKLYVPVKGGKVQPTSIVFTHSAQSVAVTISALEEGLVTPTFTKETTGNLGGVLNTFYQTTVTLNDDENISEKNDGFNLKVKQGEYEANVVLATYEFPKALPMQSENWVTDNNTNNINGYDESEHYYWYMVDAQYVKWDAERKNVVFLNRGANTEAGRQVVFGFYGLPDEVQFQSRETSWIIEESVDNESWNPVSEDSRTIITDNGVNTITQSINHTSKYIRITYSGSEPTEVLLNKLIVRGIPSAVPDREELRIIKGNESDVTPPSAEFQIHVMNLDKVKLQLDNTEKFKMYYGSDDNWTELTNNSEPLDEQYDFLAMNEEGDISIKVEWINSDQLVNDGYIKIINPDSNDEELAVVRVVASKSIIKSNEDEDVKIGIWTGVPQDYTISDSKDVFEEYDYHEVDLINAFSSSDCKPLFDYIVIYGQTTTTDESKTIREPSAVSGSNAKTPYYIYKRNGNGYNFVEAVENANASNKAMVAGFTQTAEGNLPSVYIDVESSLRVYMTGFCPYATTGQDKAQEGVWFFRGKNGETLDVYLEDCHIYSRNKTELGIPMNKDDENASIFTEDYALGSGGVLVFENTEESKNLDLDEPFKVNIHTIGRNIFKSNFGSFFEIFGMRAYQISAPLHIHMNSYSHVSSSKTELTLDDVWPTELDESGVVANSVRTNGFLSLQKQSNNAPSIDLGNPHSVVNFRGGRVELENAQIVSPNYKTTLAISYRSGEFGAEDLGIQFAYGIGTDAVGGTVNFYDGTTTVLPMEVDAKYRQYYLMDTEPVIGENGNPELDSEGNPVLRELTTTSCLRTPRNTYVHGGSQCFMRACSHVTSKGGAPKDMAGSLLGQYVYNMQQGGSKDQKTGLVSGLAFPENLTNPSLIDYYVEKFGENYTYGLESVTPDEDDKLYFWIPEGYGGVSAEQDKLLTTWKACMTEIEAGMEGVGEGSIGGDTPIEESEEVKYLLYCKIDDKIHSVVSETDENGNLIYQAPVKVPDIAQEFAGGQYMDIPPTHIGNKKEHQVLSEADYTITDKVYYVTTATADVWMTFTAPFDVEKIWVVETYSESELIENARILQQLKDNGLSSLNPRQETMKMQAKHNADFAAFFGVAMALGSIDDFETIFNDWKEWGIAEDKKAPEGGTALYSGTGKYTLRDKYELTPYTGSNWNEANFYLNHNNGEWGYSYLEEEGVEVFTPQWETPTETDGVLLKKGDTYSMLFPYCVGCWDMETIEGEERAKEREYWDYWSGKFLIFEGKQGEQKISGSDFLQENIFDIESNAEDKAYLRGNSTFAFLETTDESVYPYIAEPNKEEFSYVDGSKQILPTGSFLLVPPFETQILSVSRTGQIKYRPTSEGNDDTTGGHVPTVGDGSDIFVIATTEGINIVVSEPQNVEVFAANGALIFNGWVETSVDVNLVVDGVYVVVGENTSLKVLY